MSGDGSILARGPARKRGAPPLEYSLLLTATLCLLAIGAVMVFSASSARSLLGEGGDGYYFLKRTLLWAAVGLLVMRVASVRGVKIARAVTPIVVGAAIVMLLAVLLPGVGQTVNGAQRWIGAGALQFQPSEVAKIAIVLYAAHMLAQSPKRTRSLESLAPLLVVSGICIGLVAMQPDLGTILASTFGLTSLLIVAGVKPRTLAPLALVALVGVLGLIATNPYQQDRLTGFLHPSADTEGAGFQSNQAKIALGSGGVLGVGLGESVQKAFYLPESHTDMIAAVLGEEAGLAGIGVLIGLFGMFAYGGFRAAHRARDRYSKLLAAGLTAMIVGQAVINLFAVMGLAPLTGVPLPFVSYGGTSLVVTLAAAGLLLNVARGRSAAAAMPVSRKPATARSGARLRSVDGQRAKSNGRPAPRRDRGRGNGRTRRAGDSGRRRAAR